MPEHNHESARSTAIAMFDLIVMFDLLKPFKLYQTFIAQDMSGKG